MPAPSSTRNRLTTLSKVALALLVTGSTISGLATQAGADILCDFPGHSEWTQGDGTPVQSAAWLEDVVVIDTHTDPPTEMPVSETSFTTSAGNIVRAELYVCNSVTGSSDNYAAVYQFRPDPTQPNWNSRDKVGFNSTHVNVPVEIGTYFQQIGVASQNKITPLLEHFEATIATGPALNVTASDGVVPSADGRGPPNGGACGSLQPGQYQAQIAQWGKPGRGVWDNLKGGAIDSLSNSKPNQTITVTLQSSVNKTRIPFEVGDPVTIEGASPAKYNGTWQVTAVTDESHFVTTGPNTRLRAGSGGKASRYYASGDDVPMGILLAGYAEICAGTKGVYFATEKLEPGPSMTTVRWESESRIPGGVGANRYARAKWYQTMPCVETGDLKMWPRVVQTPGALPDDNLLAEGPAFVFHVVDTPEVPSRCPPPEPPA
jgi:hypothetical protein